MLIGNSGLRQGRPTITKYRAQNSVLDAVLL